MKKLTLSIVILLVTLSFFNCTDNTITNDDEAVLETNANLGNNFIDPEEGEDGTGSGGEEEEESTGN